MQANKLRAQMALKGITQKELANNCGMTENTLTNKMQGRTEFQADEIIRICELLEIDDPVVKADIFLN